MAVFLTGGTGKVASRIAGYLQKANHPFILGSRRGQSAAPSGMSAVKFDWFDESTFEAPFEHSFSGGEKISAIFLVAPTTMEPAPIMNQLVDLAVKHGVNRFVLLAGSLAEPGPQFLGPVWQHLIDLKVEFTVLQPTWFMENLSEMQYVQSIKEEGKIKTACGEGKIPFISAGDIAAVAFHGLTDKEPVESVRIAGPEFLTYDDIASKMSKVLGRKIEHVKLTQEEAVQQYTKVGTPPQIAYFLGFLENLSKEGKEERGGVDISKVAGRPALKFDDWLQENKSAWD